MNYDYYPGCSLYGAAADYQMSIDAVCRELGMTLREIEDWNCCGATSAVAEDQKTALALPALNLLKCREEELVVSCNACYLRLKQVRTKFAKYPSLAAELTEMLTGKTDQSSIIRPEVKHLLQIFVENVGLESIEEKVSQPLTGLKLVPYYGCQIVRPGGFDDPEQPMSLDHLLSSLGAQVMPYYRKARCCGGSLIISSEAVALRMIKELFDEAQAVDAHAIVVTCPLCQLNLDAYQDKVNKKYSKNYQFPVPYFTQLMGLAFGLDRKVLGLNKGIVSTKELMNRPVKEVG